MSTDLHKLKVEITAEIKNFKKKCDEVKAEARKVTSSANKSFSNIGSGSQSKISGIVSSVDKYCKKMQQFAKAAKVDAGTLEPTKEYSALQKQISKAEDKVKSLKAKQDALGDAGRTPTKKYETLSETIRSTEKRLDELIDKQIKWSEMGGSVTKSSAFQELDREISDVSKELDRYKQKQKELETSGSAFSPSEKWKSIQKDIAAAREEIQRYKAEAADMEHSRTDYQPSAKTSASAGKAYAAAAAKKMSDLVKEAGKTHPALQKAITLMQKFGNAGKRAGNIAEKAFKASNVVWKQCIGFLKKLQSGFGKVYEKIKSVTSALNLAKKSSDSFAGSGGKLGRMWSMFKMTAGFMAASYVFMGAMSGISDGFINLSKYSRQTNADLSMILSSLTRLKNSLATAFAPVLSVVAPIMSTFIDWLSAGMTAMAHFLAAITGKSQVVVARKVNQDFSSSVGDAGDVADDAADKVEKYKRSLMGFDQINKLDDPSSGSDSGNTGGAGFAPGDLFETVEVESTFADWAEKFKEAWENADFTEIGRIVGEKLNSALESIPWDEIKATSAKIAKSIATFLNGFIEATDWNLVGKTFAEGLNTVIEFGYSFVTNFNWSNFGKAIGDSINGFFENLDLAKAGKALSEGIKGVLDTGINALETVDWSQIGTKIADFVANIDWIGVAKKAMELLGNAIIGSMNLLDGFIDQIGDHVKEYIESGDIWKDAIGAIELSLKIQTEIVGAAWNLLKTMCDTGVSVLVSLVKSGWNSLSSWIGEKVDVIVNRVKGWTTKLSDFIGDSVPVTIRRVKGWTTKLKDFVGHEVRVTVTRVKGWTSKLKDWVGAGTAILLKFRLPRIKVKWGSKTVAGFTIKYPNGFSTYAKGGFPEEGPFLMNKGEIAGKFSNGKGVVANNYQITKGIADAVGPAVYEAVIAAMSKDGGSKGNVTVVLEGKAGQLFKAVKTEAENYTKSTGKPAFPV